MKTLAIIDWRCCDC